MDKRREAFEAWWFVPIEEQKENLSPKEIAFMAWQAAEASLVERLNAREPVAWIIDGEIVESEDGDYPTLELERRGYIPLFTKATLEGL